MRTLLLPLAALIGLLPTSVLAVDQSELDHYDHVRLMCRMGEDESGPIPREASDKACADLKTLGKSFNARGYCWDNGEQTWGECG